MTNITLYKVETYNSSYYKVFAGVYNDFKNNAAADYNFELEPLEYDAFIKSIEQGLLNCIVLLEDGIPTGFLVYTTLVSESLELNIIHCLGNENINQKRKLLLEKFIEMNKFIMRDKIVTYPMLGKQASFCQDIESYGFKMVNTSVMTFNLTDSEYIERAKKVTVPELPKDYSISNWKTTYFKNAAEIMAQSFVLSSDALFDSRFTSINGCKDIVEKITDNVYGEFLPGITKVLLYKKHPVGLIFANLTNEKIANIPISAIVKKHRNMGFGKILLKRLVDDLITSSITGGWALKELNVSCDTDNKPAVGLYSALGFTQTYTYAQAYHPKTK